jgi:hypothetical protein
MAKPSRCDFVVTNRSLFFSSQEASRLFGLGKETAFHKTTTDDYIELLKDREFENLKSFAAQNLI